MTLQPLLDAQRRAFRARPGWGPVVRRAPAGPGDPATGGAGAQGGAGAGPGGGLRRARRLRDLPDRGVPPAGGDPPRPAPPQGVDGPPPGPGGLAVPPQPGPHPLPAPGRGRDHRPLELPAPADPGPPGGGPRRGQPRHDQAVRAGPPLGRAPAGADRRPLPPGLRHGGHRRRRGLRRLQRPPLRPPPVYRLDPRGEAGDARREREPDPRHPGAGRQVPRHRAPRLRPPPRGATHPHRQALQRRADLRRPGLPPPSGGAPGGVRGPRPGRRGHPLPPPRPQRRLHPDHQREALPAPHRPPG